MLIDEEAPRVIEKVLSGCYEISRVYLKYFVAWVLKY